VGAAEEGNSTALGEIYREDISLSQLHRAVQAAAYRTGQQETIEEGKHVRECAADTADRSDMQNEMAFRTPFDRPDRGVACAEDVAAEARMDAREVDAAAGAELIFRYVLIQKSTWLEKEQIEREERWGAPPAHWRFAAAWRQQNELVYSACAGL
jgi:hypothetical protein